MELIRLTNVTFGYDETPCLAGVSLHVYAGEFIAITGPNGAAKSTMLKLMLGLLKPWSGEILRKSAETSGEKLIIGYVPQQVAAFNVGFPSTVLELVKSGRYPHKRWFRRLTKADLDEVQKALHDVGMWEHRHKKIGELSGGQKQRICLARALVMNPDILVLDEPVTGMDQESRIGLYALLQHNVKVHGRTVLMVTHDVEDVRPRVDRLIRLERKERGAWKCFSSNSCSVRFGPEG